MHVLSISYHHCIRVFKETLALYDRGIKVRSMCHHFANDDLKTIIKDACFYDGPEDLKLKLALMDDIDLIHIHNEPSWMVAAAKEARPDLPVIFDVHDLASQQEPGGFRAQSRIDNEMAAFYAADGYVFPSYGYQDKVQMEYGIMKPSTVLHPYCNRDLLFLPPLPRIRGIVYEGGVIAPKPTAHGTLETDRTVDYRDHTSLAQFLTSHGIPFSIYGVSKSARSHYLETGAMCFTMLPYFTMIRQLSRYDWGFVGAIKPNRAIEDCMPNKLFEYVISGIPVIVCNAGEAGEYVEDHGLGIHVKNVYEIKDRYDEHGALRKTVQDKRHEFIMEDHIEDVLKFYDVVRTQHGERYRKEIERLGVRR